VEGTKFLILMINPLSSGFASHLDNPTESVQSGPVAEERSE